MKKLSLLTAVILLLTACTQPAPPAVSAADAARAVVDSQSDKTEYTALSGEELENCLIARGLRGWAEGAAWTASGVDPREVVVAVLSEEGGPEEAARALNDYLASRKGDFYGYDPAGYALLEDAVVLTSGSAVALLVCADMTAARAAFGEGTPAAPEPTLDARGFKPFRPPNEVDMALYDSAPVLAAWAAGDPSGLDGADGAIYAAAAAALEECLSPGMTDFEKELALHDWLMENGQYDDTSRDNKAHLGRSENRTPYGMLVTGYGICLGYATTFQLLMDMAGVECITVVGASADSTSDHAWNMVRLEGEWYCVDPTWNDSLRDSAGYTQAEIARERHRWFNVTSGRLRETNHQWDYENTPEAAADRFRWDGAGEKPT